MARGRKQDNVAALPGAAYVDANEPNEAHKKLAAKWRPRGLTDEQKKVWNSMAPRLVMLNRLKPHFVNAFADYCYLYCKLAKFRKKLDDDQWFYVVEGRNGTQHKAHPDVAQANEIWRQLRTHIGEFGLAPASDKGLKTAQGDMFDDDFADL